MKHPILGSTRGQARRLASGLPLLLAAVSTGAFGQATVNPSTQPTMTLAPYVLQNTNLERNTPPGTRAYRPWFENGAWTGDLLEYEITGDGVRVVRDDVGRYPRDSAIYGENWRGAQVYWSARMKFPDWEPYDVADEATETCSEEDPNYWKMRNLLTLSDGARVPFAWDALTAAQRDTLDSATCGLEDGDCAAEGVVQTDPYASPLLNYLRGDRSNEYCKVNGVYRWRFSLLGDVVNSRPVYVPPVAGGDGLVLVGSNGGKLHAFSAADGSEIFGYIPSLLLDTLGHLRHYPYEHRFYVDGELRHRDIGTLDAPQHIVAGGLGAGGKGLFVLDVTDPQNVGVLAEISGRNLDHIGGTYDNRIGHIHGRPVIVKLASGWHAISGNGYLSEAGTAQLVLIPLGGGSPMFITTDATGNNGLSAPAVVAGTNGLGLYAYAGDKLGNLWRFNLESNTSTKLFAAGVTQPITAEPELANHPTGVGRMVYFGTGSLLSGADISKTDTQSLYGIWDRDLGSTVPMNRLVSQELITQTIAGVTQGECAPEGTLPRDVTARFIRNQQEPNWVGDAAHLGWRVNLPRGGERVVSRAIIRAGRLQVTTTNPFDMQNILNLSEAELTEAGSWNLQLSLATGGSQRMPIFDVNRDCVLDTGDRLIESETIEGFPVSMNMGPYNVAQPAIARVRTGPTGDEIDGVYINALMIPPDEPPTQGFSGQIDVTTWSPNGLVHKFCGLYCDEDPLLIEPIPDEFGLRQFPEASGPTKPYLPASGPAQFGDSMARRVDGHSFGYNRLHGVNFIDFIDLEPRRGKLRLDIGAVREVAVGVAPINPRLAEQELNRVTEVQIDAANQKFIVVLANADLSQSNQLQIGCQTWPVYEYQTEIAQHLRGKTGADLDNAVATMDAAGLVFTLEDIQSATGCDNPTLRITPTDRVGKVGVLQATLPGCVNNTDVYVGSPPNTYQTRKSEGAWDNYLVDPQVTVNLEGQGYRWRNGALTIQLLAVNPDNSAAFTLQDLELLPVSMEFTEGEDVGWGGIYAKGFTLTTGTPGAGRPGRGGGGGGGGGGGNLAPVADLGANGLLYESSVFWHWGDMTRFQTEGGGAPVSASCYGDTRNNRPSLMYETEWFTPGAYKQLTDGFDETLQQEYLDLLAMLASGDEGTVRSALERLGELFANPDLRLADYHRLRHYVPNSKQLQDHHLITIDRRALEEDAPLIDGTPAGVEDVELDLLPALGAAPRPGRWSWTDITPAD
jgi:outer membrane protein assembly factor BamB